jgi:hypothetical protein
MKLLVMEFLGYRIISALNALKHRIFNLGCFIIDLLRLCLSSSLFSLTLTLLTWTIWRAPTNASKWRMGFNSAFKGLSSAVQMLCRSPSFHFQHNTARTGSPLSPSACSPYVFSRAAAWHYDYPHNN